MADMKFSCPQCGQHIAYGEPWAGHQIQCPACHSHIVVPQIHGPSALSPGSGPSRESSGTAGPKLAAGATQVPRSTAHAPAPARKLAPHPPRSENSLLKYGVLLTVVAVLVGVGYFYGLPLLTNVLQPEPNAKPSAGAKTSQASGAMGGPMGEVNAAMDVSETLDGGSSPKAHPAPATNNTARSRPATPSR